MSAASIAAIAASLLSRPELAGLRARYEEPWRHYHRWAHPLAMLDHLAAAQSAGVMIADPVAAVGFVLWHDAIYDPQASSGRNERLSAALCAAEFAALADEGAVARAVTTILATIDHQPPVSSVSPDGALLLDIDLSILGAGEAALSLTMMRLRANMGMSRRMPIARGGRRYCAGFWSAIGCI